MVEGACLESMCTFYSVPWVRIPSSPPEFRVCNVVWLPWVRSERPKQGSRVVMYPTEKPVRKLELFEIQSVTTPGRVGRKNVEPRICKVGQFVACTVSGRLIWLAPEPVVA